MPHIALSYLTEQAVLLPWAGTFDSQGEPRVGAPELVYCKWNYGRGTGVDSQGNLVSWDASVQVEDDIDEHSLMILGGLSHWLGTGSGTASYVPKLFKVVKIDGVPDLGARVWAKTVRLMRYSSGRPRR